MLCHKIHRQTREQKYMIWVHILTYTRSVSEKKKKTYNITSTFHHSDKNSVILPSSIEFAYDYTFYWPEQFPCIIKITATGLEPKMDPYTMYTVVHPPFPSSLLLSIAMIYIIQNWSHITCIIIKIEYRFCVQITDSHIDRVLKATLL